MLSTADFNSTAHTIHNDRNNLNYYNGPTQGPTSAGSDALARLQSTQQEEYWLAEAGGSNSGSGMRQQTPLPTVSTDTTSAAALSRLPTPLEAMAQVRELLNYSERSCSSGIVPGLRSV